MASDILTASPLFRPGTFAEPGGVEGDGGRGEGDGPKGDQDRIFHSSTRSRKRGWSLKYVDLELKKSDSLCTLRFGADIHTGDTPFDFK